MDMWPGWAKRVAEIQVQAYRTRYGLDNFDPVNGIIVPVLMNHIRRREDSRLVWGESLAIRDFAYSEDATRGWYVQNTDEHFKRKS